MRGIVLMIGLLLLVGCGPPKSTEQQALDAIDKGSTLFQKRQMSAAIACFNKAIRLNPNLPIAYYWRGVAYSDVGRSDDAITDLTEVIRLDATSALTALAHNMRGHMYRDLGEQAKARQLGYGPE